MKMTTAKMTTAAWLPFLLSALMLAGCARLPPTDGTATQSPAGAESSGAAHDGHSDEWFQRCRLPENPSCFIDDIPGDFFVKYDIKPPAPQSAFVLECARTAKGYYYNESDLDVPAGLYIKKGETYDTYTGKPGTVFAKTTDPPLSRVQVEFDTPFQLCASWMIATGQLVKATPENGGDTVLGRATDKWDAGGGRTVWSDKETKICLKGELGDGTSYEATEFKTRGITLPEHK